MCVTRPKHMLSCAPAPHSALPKARMCPNHPFQNIGHYFISKCFRCNFHTSTSTHSLQNTRRPLAQGFEPIKFKCMLKLLAQRLELVGDFSVIGRKWNVSSYSSTWWIHTQILHVCIKIYKDTQNHRRSTQVSAHACHSWQPKYNHTRRHKWSSLTEVKNDLSGTPLCVSIHHAPR